MVTPKRVLFVATYPSPGMIPFAASIINSFYEAGHDTWALTVSNPAEPFSSHLHQGVKLTEFSEPASLHRKIIRHFLPIEIARKIKAIADKNHIENIHFLTGEYGFALYQGRTLARKYNLIYTVHDLEKHPQNPHAPIKDRLFSQYFHLATLRLARIVHTITSSSKAQCHALEKVYPNKKVVFHEFPPLVTLRIKQGKKEVCELKDMDNYILFFGTYTRYKGVDLLYKAFIKSRLNTKCTLVLAGAGDDFFTRDAAEKHIIRINRFLQDEEIADLFKKARFVVYPYIQVTQSGVLSIAHYFGKRVLASDLPFFADNINTNDRLFPAGNMEALAESLKQMYDNAILPYSSIGEEGKLLVSQLLKAYV